MKQSAIGNFWFSIVLFQLVPLMPLWFELVHHGRINADGLIITLSIYSFATGFSSIYPGMCGVCLLIGFLEAGLYDSGSNNIANLAYTILIVATVLVSLAHTIERYKRHCENKEPLFLWNNK